MQVNFVEANPVPVKAAMAAMGLLEESVPAADVPADGPSRASRSSRSCRTLDLLKTAVVH